MGGNCTNIAVLLNRCMDFCVQLSQDADAEVAGINARGALAPRE
jgi:hypothetical protein